ncbi:MAG TPA: F0F1 ATP synthase subunit B [Rubricoccaceae bacterium]|jgi:F-type H+-transporting ATPase subunit b
MSTLLAAGLLSPNLGLAFWVVLAFLLLLGLLGKFAWPAILGGLREREQTIESSMSRAENALAEAKRLQADNDLQRQEAGRQAQAILREARESAAQMREADVERTKAELARMQAQATADIDRQKQQALAELRSEVATLAIGAAEKILGSEIDDAKQRQLVDRFIADLPQN